MDQREHPTAIHLRTAAVLAAHDPFLVAEDATGQHPAVDERAAHIALVMEVRKQERLRALRQEDCDTYLGCDIEVGELALVALGARRVVHQLMGRTGGGRREIQIWVHDIRRWVARIDGADAGDGRAGALISATLWGREPGAHRRSPIGARDVRDGLKAQAGCVVSAPCEAGWAGCARALLSCADDPPSLVRALRARRRSLLPYWLRACMISAP